MADQLILSQEQAYALVFKLLQEQGAIVKKTGGEEFRAIITGLVANSSQFKVEPSKITAELADVMTEKLSKMPGTSSSFSALYDIKRLLKLGNENMGLSTSDLEKAAQTVVTALGEQGKVSKLLSQAEANLTGAIKEGPTTALAHTRESKSPSDDIRASLKEIGRHLAHEWGVMPDGKFKAGEGPKCNYVVNVKNTSGPENSCNR